MPMFYKHLPTCPIRNRAAANIDRIINHRRPIGVISEGNHFAYGFDGDKYFVTQGVVCEFVTGIHLSFEEAKALFDALQWNAAGWSCYKAVTAAVRKARKKKLAGDSLFWFFQETLS